MKIKIAKIDFIAAGTRVRNPSPLSDLAVEVLQANDRGRLPESCIRMVTGAAPAEVAAYMNETGVWNTIQDEPGLLANRLAIAAHLIEEPEDFFDDPSREILQEPFTERRWKFRSTAEKNFVLKMMQQHIQEISGANGVAEAVTSIADELFTNALFNAPFGDLDSSLDRSTLVVLDPEMSANLIVGHTKERLFIGCVDAFGSLDCAHLLNRINERFMSGISRAVNMEKGGAGIGIFRMIDLSTDIYVVVEKNKKTLVGCSFALNRSPKKIRLAPKSFYFQSYQNIEFEKGSMRIERRRDQGYLRIFGDISSDFPFSELDLVKAEKITIDLRFLKQTSQNFQFFLDIPENFSSVKMMCFENVPFNSVIEIDNVLMKSRTQAEIQSLLLPFFCSTCKTSENVIFIKHRDAPPEIDKTPKCPKCDRNLNPDGEIQKWLDQSQPSEI